MDWKWWTALIVALLGTAAAWLAVPCGVWQGLGLGFVCPVSACKVTEVCEHCSEDGDPGTKLRIYTQHCKDQALTNNYEFLNYHPGPVAQCDFIRKFQSDIGCRVLGLQPVR
jgi:hypothetical protein